MMCIFFGFLIIFRNRNNYTSHMKYSLCREITVLNYLTTVMSPSIPVRYAFPHFMHTPIQMDNT